MLQGERKVYICWDVSMFTSTDGCNVLLDAHPPPSTLLTTAQSFE